MRLKKDPPKMGENENSNNNAEGDLTKSTPELGLVTSVRDIRCLALHAFTCLCVCLLGSCDQNL